MSSHALRSSPEIDNYNIYYESITGRPTRKEEAATCINLLHDSIPTRASVPPICLDYARGRCSRSSECRRLHRLPNANDEDLPHSVDIFGRQRPSLGPASFLGQIRSVVFKGCSKKSAQTALLDICRKVGPIINYSADNELVVTFRHRIYAEFVIEALARQRLSTIGANCGISLEGNELINIAWAQENITVDSDSALYLY